MSFPNSRHRPCRLLTQEFVVVVEKRLREPQILGSARVAKRNQRIAAEVARVVPRDVEPVVLRHESTRVATPSRKRRS